jgi:4-hydroxy-tetrahydrodipicolinate synthase
MNSLRYLKGSITAIVTPFDNNGAIDYESYKALLDIQLKNGTSGIVVAGTTGESAALSEEEYAALIRFTVQHINGEIPVIVGAGSNVTARAIRHSYVAKREGADALLILNPYYNKPTEEGIFKHYKAIADSTELPIILYNVPGRTGYNMKASLTLRLANEIENIIGIKEASGNINQIMEIIDQRPEDFKVFSGDDALTLAVLAAGGDGCISVVSNQVPLQFSRMINAALAGDFTLARKIHYELLNLMNLNFVESNPIPVKTTLHMMGLIKNNFRMPMLPMENEIHLKLLNAELEKLNLIKKPQSHSLAI